MFFEGKNNKIYSSEEVDMMSTLEIEEYGLHVYEGFNEET